MTISHISVKDFNSIDLWKGFVGKQVTKTKNIRGRQPKPFKSGSKVNTVKGIIVHPILFIPAFTFEEDDSYVECRRCYIYDHIEVK